MIRENSKRRTREGLSTKAEHSGGVARSSDEVSVMDAERRGYIISCLNIVNRKWEELVQTTKSVCD